MTLFVGLVFSCSCKATAGEVDAMGPNWYEVAYDFLACKCESLNLYFSFLLLLTFCKIKGFGQFDAIVLFRTIILEMIFVCFPTYLRAQDITDVITGATGTAAVAPKFSDTLTQWGEADSAQPIGGVTSRFYRGYIPLLKSSVPTVISLDKDFYTTYF